MRLLRQFSSVRWWLFPLCAALFIVAIDCARWKQVERISAIGREGNSPDRHWLIIPEHQSGGYQWLSETEQMLTTGQWRVREINYENSPAGREVHTASPYRWWLGILSWVEHITGQSWSQAIEHAAVWSGPLLHLLLLVASTVFIARRFGPHSAAVAAIAIAALYPFAGEFLPSVPDDHGLAVAFATGSVLLLIAAINGHHPSWTIAGVLGGIGLWLDASTQVPVLACTGIAGILLAAYDRFAGNKSNPAMPLGWNRWALAGATTSLLAYLIEYFPDHLDWRLETNHPLYGLAWIGLGALLTLIEMGNTRQRVPKGRTAGLALIALAGLAALPVAMWMNHNSAFLVANPAANRLTALLNGPVAPDLLTWLGRDGAMLPKLAAIMPFLLLIPLALAWRSRKIEFPIKRCVVFSGSAMLAVLFFAFSSLRWWTMAQALLIVLLVAALPLKRISTMLLAVVCLLPSLAELISTARVRDTTELTRLEAESLVERDIAYWIADHSLASRAVFLAAPERTPGMCFHGALRGLGSPNWENAEGVAATTRILSATTSDEAQALFNQRNVTYFVLATWDADLDEFVRWSSRNPNDSFLSAVKRWALPPWIQPQSYHLPEISGFEGQSVVIFKITDDTDRALSLSRLAEYALEVEDTALASATNDALQSYPASFAALIARAQLEKTLGHAKAFDQIATTLRQGLANGLARVLPWDRRVSLAVVLAQDNQMALARSEAQRCLAELDEAHIRSLGGAALYRLLVLSKNFALPVTQPGMKELMLSMLPTEARERLR